MRKVKLLTLSMLVSCSLLASADPKEDADKAIAAAMTANKKVNKVGYQWRDAGKYIKKAEKAAAGKDYKKAIILANKAENQGRLAFIQYTNEMTKKK